MIKNQNNSFCSEQNNQNHVQFNFLNENKQQQISQKQNNFNFNQSNHNHNHHNENIFNTSQISINPNNSLKTFSQLQQLLNGQIFSKNQSSRISNIQNCLSNNTSQDNKKLKNHSQGKIDRQLLLQKKKSYAQTIRQKNKIILQQKQKIKKDKSRISVNSNNNEEESIQINNLSCIMFKDTSMKNINQPDKNNGEIILGNSKQQLLKLKNNPYFIANNNVSNKSKGKASTKNSLTTLNNTIQISNPSIKSFRENKQNKTNQQELVNKSANKKSKNINTNDIFENANNQLLQKKSVMNLLLKNHHTHKRQIPEVSSFVNKRMNSTKILQKKSLKSMKFDQEPQNQQVLDKQQKNSNINKINKFLQIPAGNIKTELKQIKNAKKQLKIQSNTINLNILNHDQFEKLRLQQQKQINLLKKQNGTFKKQLANFRKQNTTLKKQLQQSKKHTTQLQQKSLQLFQKNQQLTKSLQNLTFIHSNHPKSNSITSSNSQTNLQQILSSYQSTFFSLKSAKNALQLKVYMLQKKLQQQQQSYKKRIATEMSNWRIKYNKLKNQHLKVKCNYINFKDPDESIDMDISRDQNQ